MRYPNVSIAALVMLSLFATCLTSERAAAQANPSAEQIIKSLTPTDVGGATRGIRVGKGSPPEPNARPSTSLSVLFATGSAELTPDAIRTLDELGRALTDARLVGSRFRIEGHTDTVGKRDANKILSDQRARAVAAYLATRHQVANGRIDAVGLGEEGLLVQTPPQTPEPRNRRVVVVNLGG